MTPEFSNDGRRIHRIRQSTLGNYLHKCAEQTRAILAGEVEDARGDAAAVGTAVHAGIEANLREIQSGGEPLDLGEQAAIALNEWHSLAPTVKWNKLTLDKGSTLVTEATRKWHAQVLPEVSPIVVEHHFSDLVFYEDEKRIVLASGTIDMVDEAGLLDWKTSSQKWLPSKESGPGKRWEKQRWDVQSTLYLWAAQQEQLPIADSSTFTFVVMVHGQEEIEYVSVSRDASHLRWLQNQAYQFALQCEANLPIWPLNDGGWWCSEVWCPNHRRCRGAV